MGCFKAAGSKQTSTSYTPEQGKWLTEALKQYGPQLGQGEQGYPGQRVAEFTPTQKAALGGTEGFLDQFSPDAPMPMYGETGKALGGILSGQTGAQPITPQQTQSFFKSAIQDPAQYQFEEYTRPLIREEYAGPGFWGSARAGAVGRAGQDLGMWLGQKRGELEWQAGETNRGIQEAKAGRALGAVPMGMEYAGQPTREAGARLAGRQGVFGFAGAGQQQQQNLINSAIQKFQEGKRLTDQENLSVLMGLLNMSYSTTEGSQRGAGMFGGTAGFQNLMEAGAVLEASDRRLKENISTIENALEKVMTLDGKTYNFKEKDGREAGLIAQDLEKVLPESVTEEDGIKFVKPFAVIALLVNAVKELAEINAKD